MGTFGSKHEFEIGKEYESLTPGTPEEYLQAALQAEKFIAGFEKEDKDGIYWARQGEKPNLTLVTGSGGVLYFYIKLACITGEESFHTTAQKAAQYLARHWKEPLEEEGENALFSKILFGLAGEAFALLEAYDEYGTQELEDTLKEILKYYVKTAAEDGKGIRWTGSTAFGMDGAIVLFLIEMAERFNDEAALRMVKGCGQWYLANGKRHANGGLELNGGLGYNGVDIRGAFGSPNFELGTSGAAYVLTRIYELTKEEQYLNAAKAAAFYLVTVGVKQKKGFLIPYRVNDGQQPIFYLSNCHGPAGSSKLFYKLYKLTNDEYYLEKIVELVDGMEAVGAPQRQSVGFWNNYSMCCGHAGLVQFFVGLYRADHEERWRELAVRSGNVLLGERELWDDGSASWTMAFERIHPELLTAEFGYTNGAAGIACALLQLYLEETDQFHWRRMPDDPYPVD